MQYDGSNITAAQVIPNDVDRVKLWLADGRRLIVRLDKLDISGPLVIPGEPATGLSPAVAKLFAEQQRDAARDRPRQRRGGRWLGAKAFKPGHGRFS